MGLFRTVVMTVALVAGGRSLWRVRSICRPIHVPPDALLAPRASAQRHTYWDAYKVDVTDRALLLLKNTGSTKALSPSKVVEAFFTCPVFQNLERHVLKWLVGGGDPQFDGQPLKRGSRFYRLWTVTQITDEQILLTWKYKAFSGTTWFCVPKHENIIVMGSAFTLPFPLEKPVTSVQASGALFKQAFSTLIRQSDGPVSERLTRSLTQIVLASALPIHQNYSRYLLASTLKRVQQS